MGLLFRIWRREVFFKTRDWKPLPWLALTILVALVSFQAWAYLFRLPLSLGPRFILQPWLLRQGFINYENLTDLHTPLAPLITAVLGLLVPDGLRLAKLILVTILTLTSLMTFAAGKLKAGWLAGLWAVGMYVVWSPAFGLEKLWYEVFLAPIYLVWLSTYQASVAPRSFKTLLFWGFLGGVAVLIKQQAALVFAVFVLWQVLTGWTLGRKPAAVFREVSLQCLAALVPMAVYIIYQYVQAGTLSGFLYWTIVYQLTSDYRSLAALFPTPVQVMWLISSGLLLPGTVYSLFDARRKGDKAWLELGLALGLVVTSSITVYPRFGFFHLAATLPLLAVVSAMTLVYLARLHNPVHFMVLGVALVLPIFWLATASSAYRPVITAGTPPPVDEYSDLVPLAQQIQARIPPGASVYLFPDDESTSNLYYLLRKLPPRFWIFHYSWNLMDWVRNRILNTLVEQPPDWVVYFPGHQDVETRFPDILAYLHDHYQRAAIIQWAQGEAWLLKRN